LTSHLPGSFGASGKIATNISAQPEICPDFEQTLQRFFNIAVDFFGSRALGHQSGHVWTGDGLDAALLVEFERQANFVH
jgi:hypothetical protein